MAYKLENLLISTDGSDFSEGAIREGIKLAGRWGGRLTALYVIEFNPEFEALAPDLVEKLEKDASGHVKGIKERAQKESLGCETLIRRSETPYKVIVEEARRLDADAIVMGRRGRTGLKRLLMGSVTKRVIGHAPCSVLVVPRAADIKCRNILVAVDGSRFSDRAAEEAVQIAKRCGANLFAISVIHSEAASPLDVTQSQMQKGLIAEKELEEAKKNVAKVKDLAEKEGVKIQTILESGRPDKEIIEAAKDKRIDLIVMGSHGRTGLESLLMGSVAERVVGHAECATLVVKAG